MTTPAVTVEAHGAHAERDHRLAERDDDDQRVALGEVARLDAPAPGAAQRETAVVGEQRGAPADRLGGAVERPRRRSAAWPGTIDCARPNTAR